MEMAKFVGEVPLLLQHPAKFTDGHFETTFEQSACAEKDVNSLGFGQGFRGGETAKQHPCRDSVQSFSTVVVSVNRVHRSIVRSRHDGYQAQVFGPVGRVCKSSIHPSMSD